MRNFAVAALLAGALALGRPAALEGAQESDSIRVRGVDYVRLDDWARLRSLKWRLLKRDESFQLTNATARFQFFVDSREARANGLQLWLLFPLVTRDGEVFVSRLDVDATLRPLLNAPRNSTGAKIKTICLDPGHGGKD